MGILQCGSSNLQRRWTGASEWAYYDVLGLTKLSSSPTRRSSLGIEMGIQYAHFDAPAKHQFREVLQSKKELRSISFPCRQDLPAELSKA